MFADDIGLVRDMVAKYSPLPAGPIVDVGGLERPCIADYQRTVDAMAALNGSLFLSARRAGKSPPAEVEIDAAIVAAQNARYLNIARPLSFLGDYAIENPETGGCDIAGLAAKYRPGGYGGIGTAILLSVLEHVADPFEEAANLADAMAPGGLAIVSVPFLFPEHHGPEDNFRFTPSGLRHVFELALGGDAWRVEEADWRLRIDADAGVLDIKTGKPQAVYSCYCVARVTR